MYWFCCAGSVHVVYWIGNKQAKFAHGPLWCIVLRWTSVVGRTLKSNERLCWLEHCTAQIAQRHLASVGKIICSWLELCQTPKYAQRHQAGQSTAKSPITNQLVRCFSLDTDVFTEVYAFYLHLQACSYWWKHEMLLPPKYHVVIQVSL